MALPGIRQPMGPIYGRDYRKHDWWGKPIASAFNIWGEHKARQELEARQAVADARAARNEARAAQRHGEIMSEYARKRAMYDDALARQAAYDEYEGSEQQGSDWTRALTGKSTIVRDVGPGNISSIEETIDISPEARARSSQRFAKHASKGFIDKSSKIEAAAAAHEKRLHAANDEMRAAEKAVRDAHAAGDVRRLRAEQIRLERAKAAAAESAQALEAIRIQRSQATQDEFYGGFQSLPSLGFDTQRGQGIGYESSSGVDLDSPRARELAILMNQLGDTTSGAANAFIDYSRELEAEGKGPPPLTPEQEWQQRGLAKANFFYGPKPGSPGPRSGYFSERDAIDRDSQEWQRYLEEGIIKDFTAAAAATKMGYKDPTVADTITDAFAGKTNRESFIIKSKAEDFKTADKSIWLSQLIKDLQRDKVKVDTRDGPIKLQDLEPNEIREITRNIENAVYKIWVKDKSQDITDIFNKIVSDPINYSRLDEGRFDNFEPRKVDDIIGRYEGKETGSDIPGEQTTVETVETEAQKLERWRKEARKQVDAHSPNASEQEKQNKVNEKLRQLMFGASGINLPGN